MLSREERKRIARKRLFSILGRHTVALSRTLEQKISDAGPSDQRIDPHILTEARRELEKEGKIQKIERSNALWFALRDASPEKVRQRLAEQEPLHKAIIAGDFTKRMGQTAEIAVYRTLERQEGLEYFGWFPDLDAHDDSKLYSKREPPGAIGRNRIPDERKVDFLVRYPDANWGRCRSEECAGVALSGPQRNTRIAAEEHPSGCCTCTYRASHTICNPPFAKALWCLCLADLQPTLSREQSRSC